MSVDYEKICDFGQMIIEKESQFHQMITEKNIYLVSVHEKKKCEIHEVCKVFAPKGQENFINDFLYFSSPII